MRYPREKLLCLLVNSCGGKGNCITFASFRLILFSVAAKKEHNISACHILNFVLLLK